MIVKTEIDKDVKVMKERGELEMEEVSGYVICIHNNQWCTREGLGECAS